VPFIAYSSAEWVVSSGGNEMRRRVRVFGVILIWVMAAALAAVPAVAAQEGHFDRTLSVIGAADLTVQTGAGNTALDRRKLA
jgi:uncharacterized membrane protein YphA (DoxX/SURF4 family)